MCAGNIYTFSFKAINFLYPLGGSYIFAKLDITFNSILKPCQAKPAALKSLELCLESGQAFLVQAASKEEPWLSGASLYQHI